jgi:hypothetical protein
VSHVVVWELDVHAGRERDLEEAYGQVGRWAATT